MRSWQPDTASAKQDHGLGTASDESYSGGHRAARRRYNSRRSQGAREQDGSGSPVDLQAHERRSQDAKEAPRVSDEELKGRRTSAASSEPPTYHQLDNRSDTPTKTAVFAKAAVFADPNIFRKIMQQMYNLGFALDTGHRDFEAGLMPFWNASVTPLRKLHALLDLLDEELDKLAPYLLDERIDKIRERRDWQRGTYFGLRKSVKRKIVHTAAKIDGLVRQTAPGGK